MDQTGAKIVCLVILLVDTLIFGWLPWIILNKGGNSPRATHIRSIIISYLNCFAGGVFLGACLLHLLAEGRETMNDYFHETGKDVDFPVYEAVAAGGFFIIAAVEQLAHRMLHKSTDNVYNQQIDEPNPRDSANADVDTHIATKNVHYNATEAHNHQHDMMSVLEVMQVDPLRAFLLLGALSFHTVFDGLAVGLKTTSAEIWEMFAAIIIHKTLVALCLGLQLFCVYRQKVYKAFLWVVFFSLIAPLGVVIGIGVTSGSVDDQAKLLVSAVLQAMATGTFIYVTFFEILREELIDRRGFLRLGVVIIGFGGMALAKGLDKD